ncbi:MAG: alpha-L-arabinofuranosidase [Gemmatimonadota bacterium]|nr:alpha-L-arabinofuranosidase [Gemmatimonadota bacterium]
MRQNRRKFLHNVALAPAAAAIACSRSKPKGKQTGTLVVDPQPLFDISPYLHMQFMEPLGVADSSVDACWDWDRDDWREDFIEVVQDLAPDAIRWGGSFIKTYKWREGVGSPGKRPPSRNYVWGGMYTNRVGTGEFVRLCRRVGAEPLINVNFLSGGHPDYFGSGSDNRVGDSQEAADWVSYCNDPDNRERLADGTREPYNVKLWQVGNETSQVEKGFTLDQAVKNTVEFARAMRERDSSIKLIGWGGRDSGDGSYWAPEMIEGAGEYLDYVAMHMMGQHPKRKDTVLQGMEYTHEPGQAWEELNELADQLEQGISSFKELVENTRADTGIAVTEGHLSLRPHNACPILAEWLCGVFHARSMNSYQRHGDRVKIATCADFAGTRWTVNAVMLRVPQTFGAVSYLMPVGSVMRLFKRHNGRQGVAVKTAPPELDLAASRTEDRIYLHVANKSYHQGIEVCFAVEGLKVTAGRVYEIAPPELRTYVSQDRPDVFKPVEHELKGSPEFKWRFPAGSVSVVELTVIT